MFIQKLWSSVSLVSASTTTCMQDNRVMPYRVAEPGHLLNANFRHASCSAGRLPHSLSNSLIQAQMTLTSPESPTSSTILKTELMSPPALTRPHQSHSVDGLSPRPTISSVASLANKDNNQTQHVRRLSTGQMADETLPKERIDVINDFLQECVTSRPLIGIVCGSGLGGLSKCLENQEVIKYEDIPKFPRSTVEGHAGELVFGDLDGFRVVCMRGRFHCYEGYAMRETALPIRVMYLLGIKYLLVTNAAGGLNPDFNVGDLMIMNDHLNMPGLSGQHPLIGPNDARFGARFTPLSNCYDKKLQDLAVKVAEDLGLAQKVRKGVYCFVSGPTYETPTECRFLRLVGGDAVGMSTVPEVIVAAHCGLKVVGLSLITNKALFPGEEREAASHNEVLETVQATQRDIETYVRDLIVQIGKQHNA